MRQFYDDPNAEYLNADGTAKSTSYTLAVKCQIDKNKVGVLPTLTYYAKDDFDAYVRSNEMIRKHMLTGDMRADNEFAEVEAEGVMVLFAEILQSHIALTPHIFDGG